MIEIVSMNYNFLKKKLEEKLQSSMNLEGSRAWTIRPVSESDLSQDTDPNTIFFSNADPYPNFFQIRIHPDPTKTSGSESLVTGIDRISAGRLIAVARIIFVVYFRNLVCFCKNL